MVADRAPKIADIFRAVGPACHAINAGHLSLAAQDDDGDRQLPHCSSGGYAEACEDCGHWRIAYNMPAGFSVQALKPRILKQQQP